ncbi:MAG: hypothetical protein JJV92_02470 [Desulfosarcina sp.]|nr:hypothetical protein [Desulfobacterales bacterium]
MKEKGIKLGVRFNADLPALHDADFSLPGTSGTFRLFSLPLYMVDELHRILGSM